MDWNQDAVDAARAALKTVNDAIDSITMRATQLESLFVLLTTAEAPLIHKETVCLLGAELAAEIRAAAMRIS